MYRCTINEGTSYAVEQDGKSVHVRACPCMSVHVRLEADNVQTSIKMTPDEARELAKKLVEWSLAVDKGRPDGAPYKRRVVCAAIRNAKKEIICSPRHYDGLTHAHIKRIIGFDDGWDDHSQIEQGFVDQKGVFMDRVEALRVAKEAGQIVRLCGNENMLFSENLYVVCYSHHQNRSRP